MVMKAECARIRKVVAVTDFKSQVQNYLQETHKLMEKLTLDCWCLLRFQTRYFNPSWEFCHWTI